MTISGFGTSPFGTSLFGYGTPSISNSTTQNLLVKEDGTPGNVRKIDPLTGDFIVDADGFFVGDSEAAQGVYLALFTNVGTAAQSDLGVDFSPKVINELTPILVEQSMRRALAPLVRNRKIQILSISVKRRPNTPSAIDVELRWRDVSSGINQTLAISQ